MIICRIMRSRFISWKVHFKIRLRRMDMRASELWIAWIKLGLSWCTVARITMKLRYRNSKREWRLWRRSTRWIRWMKRIASNSGLRMNRLVKRISRCIIEHLVWMKTRIFCIDKCMRIIMLVLGLSWKLEEWSIIILRISDNLWSITRKLRIFTQLF